MSRSALRLILAAALILPACRDKAEPPAPAGAARPYVVGIFQSVDSRKLLGHVAGVSDQEQGHAFLLARSANQVDDLLLMPRIDVGRWLVGQ